MSASSETLGELHTILAQQLLELLRTGVPVFNKDGEETGTRKANAAELGVIVAFLSKNDIKASVADNEDMKALKEALDRRKAQVKPKPYELMNINIQ